MNIILSALTVCVQMVAKKYQVYVNLVGGIVSKETVCCVGGKVKH